MSGGRPPNNKISVRVKGLGLAKHCKHAMKGCCVKIPSSYALKMYVEMCLRSITIWHVYWAIGTQHHLLQKSVTWKILSCLISNGPIWWKRVAFVFESGSGWIKAHALRGDYLVKGTFDKQILEKNHCIAAKVSRDESNCKPFSRII